MSRADGLLHILEALDGRPAAPPAPAPYIRAADVAACDVTSMVRAMLGPDHTKAQELYGLHLQIYRRLLQYREAVQAERSA